MASPKIVAKQPMQVALEKGEHYWCACGLSKSQPFCDGSHRGTGIEPHPFTVDEPQDGYLCMCKHTKNPPYCDGTHNQLDGMEAEPQTSQSEDAMPVAAATPEEPTVELIHALARDGRRSL